ncbi:hypothetical protein K501DRAFT_269942 [Backusella circina FSU 941]|nr:hypothetical protein K501DRAFT_269942 [Backusella circina FSU 941]
MGRRNVHRGGSGGYVRWRYGFSWPCRCGGGSLGNTLVGSYRRGGYLRNQPGPWSRVTVGRVRRWSGNLGNWRSLVWRCSYQSMDGRYRFQGTARVERVQRFREDVGVQPVLAAGYGDGVLVRVSGAEAGEDIGARLADAELENGGEAIPVLDTVVVQVGTILHLTVDELDGSRGLRGVILGVRGLGAQVVGNTP